MIFSIQYDPAEDVSYVTKILNYFNGAEIFTMTGFAALIRELKGQNTSVQPQRIPPASTPVQSTTDRGSDSTMPTGTTGTCAPDTGTAESDTDSAGTGADGSPSECSAGTAG